MKNLRKGWVSATALIVVGVLTAIQYGKVAPCLPDMMERLGISVSDGGLLMSAFALSALVMAIVGGVLIDKFGVRSIGIAGLAVSLAGNIVGLFEVPVAVLMLTRVLEGIGYGVISVCGPVVISAWYSPEKRGIASGFWGSYVGAGVLVAMVSANPLLASGTWMNMWTFALITLGIAFLLFLLFVRMPPQDERQDADVREENSEASLLKGFLAPGAVLLGLMFLLLDFGLDSFNNFSVTYLNEYLGFEYGSANLVSTIGCITMILGSLVGAVVLAKSKNRGLVLLVTIVLSTACFFLQFRLEGDFMVMLVYQSIAAAIYGALPAMFYALVPEVATSRKTVGAAVAVVILGQNVGTLIGPTIVGMVVDASSWATSATVMGVVSCISIVAAVIYMKKFQK
ncbi:MFS transporter [Gordonibacter urolithinfaciens]|uniref:MFS transporter n=1 Tax=Gordonibacter urolithinfaciens TaxID=1335613 RepID=UPI003AAF084D